ncbi:MAG: diaminopimelate decarboxylase [Dehalococcoidia bacterium]|nr:diaminopimelate decarboxylase [Dehalococcoidia bacterium]
MTAIDARALPFAHVLPLSASLSAEGHLALGGLDTVALAAEYGTPLYVFDAATLKAQCRAYLDGFRAADPSSQVLYASKAFLNRPFARFIAQQGLGFDVVSGGEIEVLRAAGVDLATAYFHGNNKTPAELHLAAEAGVGCVVIDNLGEVALVEEAAAAAGRTQRVMIRVSPGIDGHTHEKTTTGILDSKFGLPIVTGAAEEAVRLILASPHLEFRGPHMHLGSPIFETDPYVLATELLAEFIADVCIGKLGAEVSDWSPGGGFAVAYRGEDEAPAIAAYARATVGVMQREADARGFSMPRTSVEPGRSIVGRAGVALYTVGARKDVPGIRTFVSVDGGMADNIRPAMYGSRYEALSAERPLASPEETVSIAGKYCESGDILIKDAHVPRFHQGEVVAIPTAGAYQLAMASNYNLAYRPAVVMVEDGAARLMRRRETAADLMAMDID